MVIIDIVSIMEKYISIRELESAALALLPVQTRDYYKSGATEEHTLAENKNAFQRFVRFQIL